MQFGSSSRVRKVGFVVLLGLFGVRAASAQYSNYGQTPGSTSGQQLSCNPADLACQAAQTTGDQGNLQRRLPAPGAETTSPQGGIVLPGQNQPGQNNGTQTQQQQGQLKPQVPLPLDSPTEFQQMVANSIGKQLPIYGVNLFRNPPSTFAPVDLVPVTPDYVIGPGDELLIQAWGQVTLNSRYIVDRSGSIYIPQAGSIHVGGLPFGQVRDFLKSQMGRVFRNFDLNVNMGELRSIQVFVVGQARRPGSYTISSLSTIVNALFATGGPTPQGSLRHIQLKRGANVVVDFDLYDLLLRGDKSKDVQLLPGDVIYIPPVGLQVAVAGSVNVPAIYELKSPDNTTLGDILALAAGETNVASKNIVRLERVDEHRMRSITQISMDQQGRATVLHDGDLLELMAVVGEYKDAITLRGNVANPGRYTWRAGMRVRDLLPDKDSLITREYWLKRSQLGQPFLTYIPTCLPATPFGIPSLRYGIPVGEEGQNPNWRYSSTRNPSLIGLVFGAEEGSSNKSQDGLSDGGLDCAAVPESQTASRGFNDVFTPAPSTAPMTTSSNQQNPPNTGAPQEGTQQAYGNGSTMNQLSATSASVGGTAVMNTSAGQFKARNDVKLSEPDIDWSYAVIERQSKENLTTSLLPFNLGKLVLEGDQTQNLELLPGDVVTIFSKADIRVPQAQQTRYVRLEGEVVSAGVYSVLPGETLRHLVERAGGVTPEAYLYGSEFTRESTRRVQQQRLNEYIDQITVQVTANATNNFGRSLNVSDSTAATAAAQQNQNVIFSLRQIRATGRIVLELPVDANNVAQLPDLPLEDGDRLIVPRIPSTVNVEGAVYNQNSFVFDPTRRVGSYIRLAGGANRDADTSRAYVIRASGSVLSKQYSSSLRGNSFDSLHIYPGDTVVIPLNLTKGQTLKTIVSIAQIVGQLGIAVAAGNTVF